jgi:hypothetical protein
VSFTVQKSLGNSAFSFSVGRRRDFRSIADETELSTGSSGEFIRHRPEIFYSSDLKTIHSPEVPKGRSISSTPFWSSLVDGTKKGWVMLGAMAVGTLLILIGLAVVANGQAVGWLEVILGLAIAGTPIVMTSAQRRQIRQHEERKRRERAERDARDRELLTAYTTSLERLREDPSPETLVQVQRENEKLDLPYAVWADTAIGTVLYVGFSTLARVGPERSAEVADLMDRSSDAAGLIAEDALAVKLALYSTILWHLLADDRLGNTQLQIVRSIQKGFGIRDEDIPGDVSAESQFERLRGIDHRNAPRCESPVPLGLNEYCMYAAEIRVGASEATTQLFITNKRLVIDGNRRVETQVPSVDDVHVDADSSRVTIRAASLKAPLSFTVAEPIYLAAMIDLATRLDDRPRGFA